MGNRAKRHVVGLADRIRSARQGAHKTQKDIAINVQHAESSVRSWELGKSEPDLRTIVILADYLGVTLDYLLRE